MLWMQKILRELSMLEIPYDQGISYLGPCRNFKYQLRKTGDSRRALASHLGRAQHPHQRAPAWHWGVLEAYSFGFRAFGV